MLFRSSEVKYCFCVSVKLLKHFGRWKRAHSTPALRFHYFALTACSLTNRKQSLPHPVVACRAPLLGTQELMNALLTAVRNHIRRSSERLRPGTVFIARISLDCKRPRFAVTRNFSKG
jgi:hypothetical protein